VSSDRPITRVAVGDPAIAKVSTVFDKQVLLLGSKVGQTNALIWEKDRSDPTSIDVSVVADHQGLIDELKADGRFLQVHLEERPGHPILAGSVRDLETYVALTKLARAYLGSDYIDQVVVLQRMMVSVEVRFAVISTSTLKTLGFDFTHLSNNFQSAIAGPSSVGKFSFDPTNGLSLEKALPISQAFNLFFSLPHANFMTVLSALDTMRVATTLAEPTLVVRSGQSAQFVSGGEIPVPVPQGLGSVGVEYHEFGIRLKLEPTVLSSKRISLRIEPEISNLDFSNGVSISGTIVPALTRRSASTTLELGSGQSFILAGLMSATTDNSKEAFPYVGSIPIFGMFFKRVRASHERQELIIVATPRLVSPIDADARTLPLPGAQMQDYDPSIADMLMNRDHLDQALPPHGLTP
jgi:pilus assembly protein CpaC